MPACGCGAVACSGAHYAPPPPPPPPPHAAMSDAALASLFPWLAMHDEPLPLPAAPSLAPVAAAPAAPAAAPEPPSAAVCADEAHEDDALCVCCLDEPRDTALAGCGDAHAPVMCAACAQLLLQRPSPLCPLCRAPATRP
jgi:hypothetical protein